MESVALCVFVNLVTLSAEETLTAVYCLDMLSKLRFSGEYLVTVGTLSGPLYSTIQFNTIVYNTIQCPFRYNTIQYSRYTFL